MGINQNDEEKYPVLKVVIGYALLGGPLGGILMASYELFLEAMKYDQMLDMRSFVIAVVVYMTFGVVFGFLPALLCGIGLALMKVRRSIGGIVNAALIGGAFSGIAGYFILLIMKSIFSSFNDFSEGGVAVTGALASVVLAFLFLPKPMDESNKTARAET